MRENKTSSILLELLAVCFLASAGIFVRRSTLPPINTGIWRMIFALPFLFVLAFRDLKTLTFKKFVLCFLSGMCLGGDLVFFNLSLVTTSMANTNLLTNMTSFIIVPVSYFVFKEKIPKFYLLGLVITLIGVFTLVLGKSTSSGANIKGDIYAICACVFYSLFMLTTYKLRDELKSSVILFAGGFGTLFFLIIVASIMEGIRVPTTEAEAFNLLGFALCMQVIGQNLLAHCQGKISVNLSIAITLLQPVFAALYSFVLFSERLGAIELIGAVIIIIGVYICKRQYSN